MKALAGVACTACFRPVTGVFGDGPALLALEVDQQPPHKRARGRRVSTRGNRATIRASSRSTTAAQLATSTAVAHATA